MIGSKTRQKLRLLCCGFPPRFFTVPARTLQSLGFPRLASGSFYPRFRAPQQRGFALFIAIVLSAVAAVITLALTTLAYKSLLLSSSALESQYAFYAADSALECALYWDNGMRNSFPYASTPGSVAVNCAGTNITLAGTAYDAHTTQYRSDWFAINGSDCARITVYKTDGSVTPVGQLFGDGVNVSCDQVSTNPRAVERGIKATY